MDRRRTVALFAECNVLSLETWDRWDGLVRKVRYVRIVNVNLSESKAANDLVKEN